MSLKIVGNWLRAQSHAPRELKAKSSLPMELGWGTTGPGTTGSNQSDKSKRSEVVLLLAWVGGEFAALGEMGTWVAGVGGREGIGVG